MSGIGRKTWLVERHVVQYQFVEADDPGQAAVKAEMNTVRYGQSRHSNPWYNDAPAKVTVREVTHKPPKRVQHR